MYGMVGVDIKMWYGYALILGMVRVHFVTLRV
jgi:hypothetical protein